LQPNNSRGQSRPVIDVSWDAAQLCVARHSERTDNSEAKWSMQRVRGDTLCVC
jgi:hypothetical protein